MMLKPLKDAGYDINYVLAKFDELGLNYQYGYSDEYESNIIWINALMQIKPKRYQKRVWPELVIVEAEYGGDKGIYVKTWEGIYDNTDWHTIRELIDKKIYDLIY